MNRINVVWSVACAEPAVAAEGEDERSAVYRWAIEAEHASENPAHDVPALATGSAGHHTWTLAEVAG